MKPAVSLLIPVFNRQDLVGPCIESALAQSMDDLEVVVVDGASTDRTWDVCLSYAGADSRVRVFREAQNSGPVRGWWRCAEEARGSYATFLWSDDLLMPSFLERTMPFLFDENIGFAYTAAQIGAAPGSGKVAYAERTFPVVPSKAFVLGSLTSRGRYPVSPACALFRLEDLRRNFMMELPTTPKVDLTATGAGTDLLLLLLTASQRAQVAHIPEPLVFFRRHEDSISIERRSQVALAYALVKSWFAREAGRPDLVATALAWHWLGEMRASYRFVTPSTACEDYGGLVTPAELVMAAIRLLSTLPWTRMQSRDP